LQKNNAMDNNYFLRELATERLLLRKFQLSDAKDFSILLKDKEVAATTLMLPFPCSTEEAEKLIRQYQEELKHQKSMRWVISTSEENKIMGAIRLVPNTKFNSAELGFWMGKKYWRQGYAQEAASRVIEYGIQELGLNRIDAHAMAENESSLGLLKKLGFLKEGYHPELVIKWGEYKDVITFGLLRKNHLNSIN